MLYLCRWSPAVRRWLVFVVVEKRRLNSPSSLLLFVNQSVIKLITVIYKCRILTPAWARLAYVMFVEAITSCDCLADKMFNAYFCCYMQFLSRSAIRYSETAIVIVSVCLSINVTCWYWLKTCDRRIMRFSLSGIPCTLVFWILTVVL